VLAVGLLGCVALERGFVSHTESIGLETAKSVLGSGSPAFRKC
jgi:hypothetical protein